MLPRPITVRLLLTLVAATAVACGGGCAGLRLPRIDPSGERLLIFPKDEPGGGQPVTFQNNALSAPVQTDPVFPQQPLPTTTPQAALQSQAASRPTIPGTIPQDYVRISPDRYLAPIGAEVVLKAGICASEGFLLKEQPMEWILGEGTGEFVALGGRGYLQPAWLPFNKPSKIDNRYAKGYTSKVRRVLTRGTTNQEDDVVVLPGESWASITSPVEGVSSVTAYSPEVKTWSTRRARATVYWVDSLWTFPTATVAATSPQSTRLTTAVRRQSDGLPVAGWLVRYEVIGGDAGLSGGGTQVVEVPTDAEGNASIDVTPAPGDGGSTRIDMQLVRPAGLGGTQWPRLVVSQSSTTVTWPGGSAPYVPPVGNAQPSFGSGPTPALPPGDSTFPLQTPPQQTTPPSQTFPSGGFNQPPPPPTGTQRPRLDLEIIGDPSAQVDGTARFELVIRNIGTGQATGIVIRDRFDPGFSHLRDPDRNLEIENQLPGTLGPGETRSTFLTFDVLRAGELCHDVTVSCVEGSQANDRACVTAAAPLPQNRPSVEVTKQGPRQATAGDSVLFVTVVRNTGSTAVTNLQVVDEYDQYLSATPTTRGSRVENNRLVWSIPRLEPGESSRFEVQALCRAPTAQACSTVRAVGDGVETLDRQCVEVLRALGAGPGQNPAGGGQPTLRVSIDSFRTTMRQGSRATVDIQLTNRAAVSDRNVQLRVIFSPELVPDGNSISADVGSTVVGNEVRFNPVNEIRANEMPLRFVIPIDALSTGYGRITAEAVSANVPQGVSTAVNIEVINR
ncbi:MAG: hypothetical protein AAGA92_09620 [Planctomycetota bacterium]